MLCKFNLIKLNFILGDTNVGRGEGGGADMSGASRSSKEVNY